MKKLQKRIIAISMLAGLVPAGGWASGPITRETPPPDREGQSGVESRALVETQPPDDEASMSQEQGQTFLFESFNWESREWREEKRREAFADTEFRLHLRTFYLHRDKYDDSVSAAWAGGGWAGFKTGYFLDHIALGLTAYTSQKIDGDDDEDGTLLLKPGQDGYAVLGEAYADIRFDDDIHLYIGRKEFDTPFINRNDTRMTPNTFEAAVLQGQYTFGSNADDGALKYGAGYFHRIKERNDDDFVSMSEDAGAEVERGVYTAGALYMKGDFSLGAIDYYSPDIINIAYLEAKSGLPLGGDYRAKLAAQFIDQRATGDNSLTGEDFSGQQFGLKAEFPWGGALFTTGFTHILDGTNMQNPWSGYPGYTGAQVEDFNREGESAFLLRAGYNFETINGLGAYILLVHGTDPTGDDQFRRDEYDANLQWAPDEGVLKGLSVRLRYAIVKQHETEDDTLRDFRAICSYTFNF